MVQIKMVRYIALFIVVCTELFDELISSAIRVNNVLAGTCGVKERILTHQV